MAVWHEHEAFWLDTASVIFNRERWEKAQEEVEQLASLVELSPGASVLDLGCGQGRHAIEFARRGFRVTGVDRNEAYLEVAREKARERGLHIEWIRSDMREFRRPATFDAAVNLLTSFGYFDDPADEHRVLDNVFASLKPGGVFAMDLMGKEVLARVFRERDWHEEPDGTLVLEERRTRDGWAWVDVRWILLRDGRRMEHEFSLRSYAASELKAMFAQAGFKDVRVFGKSSGEPYDHEAERLITVGFRPPSGADAA